MISQSPIIFGGSVAEQVGRHWRNDVTRYAYGGHGSLCRVLVIGDAVFCLPGLEGNAFKRLVMSKDSPIQRLLVPGTFSVILFRKF